MEKIVTQIFGLAIVVGLAGRVFGASGTQGADFLNIPVGAGPAALGSAYSALATDAYAPVWNPAGLGAIDGIQVAAQHLSYLESIHDEFLSVAVPIHEGRALAFSAQYLGSGDIAGFDHDGNSLPSYSSHYGAYSLAFGQALGDKLSLGITGKFLQSQLADVSATAFAADFGSLYKVSDQLSLAATLDNLGTKLKYLNDDSSLPIAGHLAAAYQPFSHWLLVVEGVFPKSTVNAAHVGIEWNPLPLIRLRAGYRTDTTKELGAIAGLSAGLGLELFGQEFSYAWLPLGDLGNTQYFSLVLRFGSHKQSQENMLHAEESKSHRTVRASANTLPDAEGEDAQLMKMLQQSDRQSR